jgi:hypothetical protein
MKPTLSHIRACFSPRPPAQEPAAPPPSLSVLLQDREPKTREKLAANHLTHYLSRQLPFVQAATPQKRVFARALTRPIEGLRFYKSQPGFSAQAAELLNDLLQLASPGADREALKAAVLHRFHDERFVSAFGFAAGAGLLVPKKGTGVAEANIETIACDAHLGPVLDRVFEQHIADRVTALLNPTGTAPVRITGRAGMLIESRAQKQLKVALKDRAVSREHEAKQLAQKQAQEAEQLAQKQAHEAELKRQAIIENHPFQRVTGLRKYISDAYLVESANHPDAHKMAELFEDLSHYASTEHDKEFLSTVLACSLGGSRRTGGKVMPHCHASAEIMRAVSQNNSHLSLTSMFGDQSIALSLTGATFDRMLAEPIAVQVITLSLATDSTQAPASSQSMFYQLVDARAKVQLAQAINEKRLNDHPIQQILDIRATAGDDCAMLTRPVITSYHTPCLEQVVELLKILTSAATSEQDKQELARVVAANWNLPTSKITSYSFADIAHQQSNDVKQQARHYASDSVLGPLLDRMFAPAIAAYVQAGSTPNSPPPTHTSVGGRAEVLVKARADIKLSAKKSSAYADANRVLPRPARATNALRLVDTRVRLTQALNDVHLAKEKKEQCDKELGAHRSMSVLTKDNVVKALRFEAQGMPNPDRVVGEEFNYGWPLSPDAMEALDQVIAYEEKRKHLALTPASSAAV